MTYEEVETSARKLVEQAKLILAGKYDVKLDRGFDGPIISTSEPINTYQSRVQELMVICNDLHLACDNVKSSTAAETGPLAHDNLRREVERHLESAEKLLKDL